MSYHAILCILLDGGGGGGGGNKYTKLAFCWLCVSAMSGFLLNISFMVPSNFETNPPPYLFNPVVKNLAEYYSN